MLIPDKICKDCKHCQDGTICNHPDTILTLDSRYMNPVTGVQSGDIKTKKYDCIEMRGHKRPIWYDKRLKFCSWDGDLFEEKDTPPSTNKLSIWKRFQNWCWLNF